MEIDQQIGYNSLYVTHTLEEGICYILIRSTELYTCKRLNLSDPWQGPFLSEESWKGNQSITKRYMGWTSQRRNSGEVAGIA